jgi:O-antigen ligase
MINLDLSGSDSLDSATSGRYDLVAGGVGLAAERPLAGHGSGSFAREYRRAEDASAQRATSASHTTPITVAAEQGVVGLAAYLALVALALRRLGHGARGSVPRMVVLAAFCGLLLHTMLYAAFLEDPLTWSLLGIGTALAAGAGPPRGPFRARRGDGRRPGPGRARRVRAAA